MDLYLTSAEPTLSLQEMIDCDIKSGMEFEPLDPFGDDLSSIDMSSMSSLEGGNYGSLFDTLDHINMMDSEDSIQEELHTTGSWMNISSMNNFSLDPEHSVMVNPSTICPSTLSSRVSSTSSTTVSSPASTSATSINTQVTVIKPSHAGTIRQTIVPNHHTTTLHSTSTFVARQSNPMKTTTINTQPINPSSPISTVAANNRLKINGKIRRDSREAEEKVFPKPAYSYSCLIALALKNSISGCLPVSEIYSFMCEHFPYFRTAPNGWKNSVRHNLSLNKCFEKIEKPVVSGSNQRKGCLWALNPAKSHKMDEEVQKWSKKDLPGIKCAMSNPDVLESLERGEMKFEAINEASSCSEDEDEDIVMNRALGIIVNEEEEDETEHSITAENGIKIVNPSTVVTVAPRVTNNITLSRSNVNHTQQIRTPIMQTGNLSASIVGQRNGLTQRIATQPTVLGIKRANSQISRSDSPEYILPESSMTEISLQSNGSLIDDLGNEIKIEGDINLSSSSPRGLVVRKLSSASPLKSTTIQANYVYTPLSSPHQHNLNRLVLTNAKMS